MTFDWSSFCSLAKELVSRELDAPLAEASWRSGTSRAYFGAYNIVRQYLADFEPLWKAPLEDSHVQLFNFVASLHVHGRLHTKVASDLKRLRVRRNAADYDPPAFKQTEAQDAVRQAEQLKTLIEDLRSKRG